MKYVFPENLDIDEKQRFLDRLGDLRSLVGTLEWQYPKIQHKAQQMVYTEDEREVFSLMLQKTHMYLSNTQKTYEKIKLSTL